MSNQKKTDRPERLIKRKLEGHNYKLRSHFSKISQHIHDTGQGIASAEVHRIGHILKYSVGSGVEKSINSVKLKMSCLSARSIHAHSEISMAALTGIAVIISNKNIKIIV